MSEPVDDAAHAPAAPGEAARASASEADSAADGRPARRGRTLKFGTILVILVGAGLGLASATQSWYTAELVPGYAKATVVVSGSDAAPALTALSLAALALAVALAIAGRFARIVVGVLGLVVAACMLWSSSGSPLGNTGLVKAVSDATAIAGAAAVDRLVTHVATTAWPPVAITAGVVVALGALAAVVTGGAWPGASRRYDAVRFDDADAAAPASARRRPAARPGDAAVDDWDELTRGDDPTASERPAQADAEDDAPTGDAPDAR